MTGRDKAYATLVLISSSICFAGTQCPKPFRGQYGALQQTELLEGLCTMSAVKEEENEAESLRMGQFLEAGPRQMCYICTHRACWVSRYRVEHCLQEQGCWMTSCCPVWWGWRSESAPCCSVCSGIWGFLTCLSLPVL